MSHRDSLSQKQRLIALLVNCISLLVIFFLIMGSWFPTGGPKDLWFYSIIGYWFFYLLASPYFVPPKDALSYAVTAMLLLATIDLSNVNYLQETVNVFRWFSVCLMAFITILSVVSIALKDTERGENSWKYKLSTTCYNLSVTLGRSEIVFAPPILISIVGFYNSDPKKLMLLSILWAIIFFIKPVELGFKIFNIIKSLSVFSENFKRSGTIVRVDDPNIIRLKLNPDNYWRRECLHIARLHGGKQVYVFPLFSQLQDNEKIGTGLITGSVANPVSGLDDDTCGVYRANSRSRYLRLLKRISGSDNEVELIGFVVEGSRISTIQFEVSQNQPLEEGMVVFVNVDGTQVYYQVLDAETSEESFSQNPRGTHIVKAVQLGTYAEGKGFRKFSWLPNMNKPVFKAILTNTTENVNEGEVLIGSVPFSNIKISANIKNMIEYHTAILGVTGTGKTDLSFEVIRAAANNKVKIICVDITGEYKKELIDIDSETLSLDEELYKDLESLIRKIDVEPDYQTRQKLKNSLNALIDKKITPAIKNSIKSFMDDEDVSIGFIELSNLANSKAMLLVTEIYLSSIMSWAKWVWSEAEIEKRTVMIALEEAHTIIPESFGSSFNHETKVIVDRIGQIALQGRKYGVGLLIVSQRTALVSKTILSQCNTYFTHALIDQTSLNYLSNVYSPEHVKIIPNLKFLELLAFGKAIPSERPLLLQRRNKNGDSEDSSEAAE